MRIWITTDTHLGHQRMIEFGRPNDFEVRIGKAIAEVVKPNDVLIHLGDFCIGKDEYWHEFYFFYAKCKNWLVRGNHDRKSNSWYMEHGWDWVGNSMRMLMFDCNILFTHRPNPLTAEPWELPIPTLKDLNIHGHLHDNGHRDTEVKIYPNYHKLVALEQTKYKPILLEKLIAHSRKAQLIKGNNTMEDTTTPTPETPATETPIPEAPTEASAE